jgi:ATP-dependent Clp protease ATP-binding subunit ClpA
VDFQNTIIIATSNAHSNFIKESLERGEDAVSVGEALKKKLTEYFKPELLNRFSGIIAFKTLSVEDTEKIAGLQLKALAKTLEASQGIRMEFENSAISLIAKEGFDPTFGARPLRGAISKLVNDPLSSKILRGEIERGDSVKVSVNGRELAFIKE